METRDLDPTSEDSRWIVFDEDADAYRYSVVPDWYDAEAMRAADVSGEIVGQRVVAYAGGVDSSPAARAGSVSTDNGVPGFLFCGDDGDSLWFWPESDEMAFRFEPETAGSLRKELGEEVSRLVSQGALVFCYKTETSGQADELLVFPGRNDVAA